MQPAEKDWKQHERTWKELDEIRPSANHFPANNIRVNTGHGVYV